MKDFFSKTNTYHLWATKKLYNIISELKDEDYRKDLGLFFKSIHGTLNHLLLVEKVWFTRFVGEIFIPHSLSDEIENDKLKLESSIYQAIENWEPVIQSFPSEKWDSEFVYKTMRGFEAKLPFAHTVQHVQNHRTHHRGQITAALTSLGYESPELDYVYFLQET